MKKTKGCDNSNVGSCKNKRVSNNTTRRQTDRSIYARKYFENKTGTIHMLDKIRKGDTTVMFQVNYKDVGQFLNYENLHNNPKLDCFFQSIFSLGLHDVKMAKKHSFQVNKKGRSGVNSNDVKLFIKNAFELTDDEIVEFYIYNNNNSKITGKKINNIFKNHLKNGYATVIFVKRLVDNGLIAGHYLVMYKYNNKIYFFDPQKKTRGDVNGVSISTRIEDVIINDVLQIGWFEIDNLKSPKPLIHTSCHIRYVG
jgi:hypothetical protein